METRKRKNSKSTRAFTQAEHGLISSKRSNSHLHFERERNLLTPKTNGFWGLKKLSLFPECKCSQMKIMEMSFMIIAIVIFFVLVGLFFLSISFSGLKKEVSAGKRESAIMLVSMLAGSPEFSCSEGSGLCVDADKLSVLKSHSHYLGFWGVAGLQVKKVYPSEGNNTRECAPGIYPNCNTFTIVSAPETGIIEDSSFVTICGKAYKNGYSYDECQLGKISVFTKI